MNRLNPGKAINQKQDEADSQKTAATKTSRRQKMSSPRAKPGEACLDQARPGPNPIQPIRQNKSPTLLGTDEISYIEDIMDSLVKTPNPDKAVEEDVFFSSHQRCFPLEKMSSAGALGYAAPQSYGYTDPSLVDGYSHLYHEGQRGKDATPSIATGPNGQSDHLRDNSSKGCCCFPWGGK